MISKKDIQKNIIFKKTYQDKYTICDIIGILLFHQIYNISMTIGLLPIMGIILPFISYGVFSLLSYMLLLEITLNISNKIFKFKT